MKKFLVILSIFAMIVTLSASVAHAHVGTDQTSEISIDLNLEDITNTDFEIDQDCDMSCGGCCVQHAFDKVSNLNNLILLQADKRRITNFDLFISDVIYDLKRPPKS